ncbi:MAG: hypothetical protein HRT89_24200, partial [Lentisphaeria bacterium]|nr:hypothetical protein [Lentisphaeria bacterium]
YAIDDTQTELGVPCDIVGDALDEDFKLRARWYNFYDKDDIIAYPLKGLSADYNLYVDGDFEINVGSATTSWNPACHSGYWEDKDFYRPVATFIGELKADHAIWQD